MVVLPLRCRPSLNTFRALCPLALAPWWKNLANCFFMAAVVFSCEVINLGIDGVVVTSFSPTAMEAKSGGNGFKVKPASLSHEGGRLHVVPRAADTEARDGND
ncbi:unnamed protein product [Cuscuta campestris]|uniref:Uncharacterized protein n=1 Tax=Cuscuta campestris TaxID=132261 RepID=A0A484LCH6_9ASTE|nr:unnamed protein product [Cuscuta campestris]